MRRTLVLGCVTAAAIVAACATTDENLVLGISATGVVSGTVFFDRNGDKVNNAGDTVLGGVRVRLVPQGSHDTIGKVTTDAAGFFKIRNVPVGSYRVVVDSGGIGGDSIAVTRIIRDTFTLNPNDSLGVQAALSYPELTVAQFRALPLNKKAFLVAVALNGYNTTGGSFGDSTLHVADTSGSIRLTAVRGVTGGAGDSIRALAVRATRPQGQPWAQPTADRPTIALLQTGASVGIVAVTSARAKTADGGTRDAALVQVGNAVIQDTATVAGGYLLTVDDSSGPLSVRLDSVTFGGTIPAGVKILGNVFTFTGVLVPSGSGVWLLRPRGAADLGPQVPNLTISQARSQAAGTKVFIVGVALTDIASGNPGGRFGDSTLHVADNTAAIRLLALKGDVAIGDSLKLFGVIGSRDGQPALTQTSIVQLLGVGATTPLKTFTTAVAATGNGGVADAALSRVLNAVISDTATVAGAFQLTVSDGSGNLEVRLDSVAFSGAFPPAVDTLGNKFDIIGVLTPKSPGVWRLKPRSSADFTKKP